MTEKEQYEVKKFLEAKGLSRDAVEGAMRSIEFHENTKEIKDSKEDSKAHSDADGNNPKEQAKIPRNYSVGAGKRTP